MNENISLYRELLTEKEKLLLKPFSWERSLPTWILCWKRSTKGINCGDKDENGKWYFCNICINDREDWIKLLNEMKEEYLSILNCDYIDSKYYHKIKIIIENIEFQIKTIRSETFNEQI